ncbi:hypothetical protein HK102_002015 [Quaeritorhiza haematococci]|nr:hypothetical protein HK102_002015 [Quaeritorhiza haematococci]
MWKQSLQDDEPSEEVSIEPPYVYYQCPCFLPSSTKSENGSDTPASIPPASDTNTTSTPSTSTDSAKKTVEEHLAQLDIKRGNFLTMFPIYRLYFCEDCRQIRCPRCVQEEIVCYFCPNCLFEVPTASVKAERNRCARNCFECPICENTLTVVSVADPNAGSDGSSSPYLDRRSPPGTPHSPGSSSSGSGSLGGGNIHYLSCGVCRWDSLEIGLKFERPTGLAMQMQKTDEDRSDVKEFEHLREYFEKVLRANNPAGPGGLVYRGTSSFNIPTSLLATIPGLVPFSSLGSRTTGSMMSNPLTSREQNVGPYESLVKLQDMDENDDDDFMEMIDFHLEDVSTLRQRHNQIDDQPRRRRLLRPQRIQLRSKRLKRCRECEHILIKPEQKAQVTRFKIKLVASDHIPTISIAHPLPPMPLRHGVPVNVILKFINPLDYEIDVALSTTFSIKPTVDYETEEPIPLDPAQSCEINLPAPRFTVPPYNEMWEYDDPSTPLSPATQAERQSSSQTFMVEGIHESKNNYTSIIVEVIPRRVLDGSTRIEPRAIVS